MKSKKSKIVILIFLFLILALLIAIFLCVSFKEEDKQLVDIINELAEDTKIATVIRLAKPTIEEYEKLIPYQESNIGAMPYLLAELDLTTREELDKLVDGTFDTETYIKTNVSYDDFRLAMLNYMTGELFDDKYSHYKDIDGYVGVQNVAAGFMLTSVQKIELISNDKNEYTFKVIIRDDEIYEHYLNGEDFEESDYLFEKIVKCKYYTDYSEKTDGIVVVSEYE